MTTKQRSNPRAGRRLAMIGLFGFTLAHASCSPVDTLPPNEQGGVGNIAITSISPSVAAAQGGVTVAIYGSGFAEGAEVAFGNRAAQQVQFVSSTHIQAQVPAAETGPGDAAVTVRNKDGSFAVGTKLFRYVRAVVSFDSERIAVGTHPVAVIAEDTNGDNLPEIITANDATNTVSVLPGNAGYKPGANYPTPVGPTALVLADFDGNGYRDLALSCNNASGQDLAILGGTGGGGFGLPVTFSVGRNPTSLAAKDLTGDGKPDVVMAPRTGDVVYVLANTSNASGVSFASGTPYALKANSAPSALVLQDLTGDVYPEILTANYTSAAVSVFIGINGGTFGPAKHTAAPAETLALAVADFSGDLKPDLAAVSFGSKTVSLFKGRGDGTFDPGATVTTEKDPRGVAFSDLDGDGKQDLVVVNSGADSVAIYLGNGDGTFDGPQTVTTGSTPYALVVRDLNLDGKPDLVTANFNGNDVSILRNKTQR